MICTTTVINVTRTGFRPQVGDDHVATVARRVLAEHRDSTTFERGDRTVRTLHATTDLDRRSNGSCTSVAAATHYSFLGAERRIRRSGSRHFGATGLSGAIPSARASKCESDGVIHSRARHARVRSNFRWLQSRQSRMSFPGFERRRPAYRTLGI
jgi:hypothetical protein